MAFGAWWPSVTAWPPVRDRLQQRGRKPSFCGHSRLGAMFQSHLLGGALWEGTRECGPNPEEEAATTVELGRGTRRQELPVARALPRVQGMWGHATQGHVPRF